MKSNADHSEKPTLVFVHIPKTAGATFSSILTRLYPQSRYSIYSLAELAQFGQVPEAARARIELLQGHFSYGIHAHLPRPAPYITFLRDPVERILSLYYYILREPATYLHSAVVANPISLADFVNSRLTSEIYNFQTRMIAGTHGPESDLFPALDEDALALAKRRLAADYSAFGITERFDESLVLLSRALGWRLLSPKMLYRKQNVTQRRKQVTEVAPEIIATIRQNNRLDLQLYAYACSLFEARWASDAYARTRLAAFRSLHRLGLRLRGSQ